MDSFPFKMFSKPGRNCSARLRILRDPLKVFTEQSRVFVPVRKKYSEAKGKLDLTEVLSLPTRIRLGSRKSPISPTSSFLAPSRDKWYNPYVNRDVGIFSHKPDVRSQTPSNAGKSTLPIVQKALRIQI